MAYHGRGGNLPEWERSRRRLQAAGYGCVALGMLTLLYLLVTYSPD